MGERDPATIKMPGAGKSEELELIMFPIKGIQQTVTPSEALSIINHISGSLMAYEHSGGYSKYERKYLSNIPAEKG